MKVLNFGSMNLDYVYTVDHMVQGGETLHPLTDRSFWEEKVLISQLHWRKQVCRFIMQG